MSESQPAHIGNYVFFDQGVADAILCGYKLLLSPRNFVWQAEEIQSRRNAINLVR